MTFFELVRSSLLWESGKTGPPGTLAQSVLAAWAEKRLRLLQPDLPERKEKAEETPQNG